MKISHHPDSATLVSFAAGSLDEAFATVVATHLASCGECRARLHQIEEVGGALLETVSAVPVSPAALERVLSRLDEPEADPPKDRRTARPSDPSVPSPLARLISGGLDDIAWKSVAPGVARYTVPVSEAAQGSLMLLKIAAGKRVPEHGHSGAELTMVLKGSYSDAFGRFGTGDVADLDEHVEHQPLVDSSESCICLVATEAPTRFKGFFGRLFQPWVGI